MQWRSYSIPAQVASHQWTQILRGFLGTEWPLCDGWLSIAAISWSRFTMFGNADYFFVDFPQNARVPHGVNPRTPGETRLNGGRRSPTTRFVTGRGMEPLVPLPGFAHFDVPTQHPFRLGCGLQTAHPAQHPARKESGGHVV